MDGDFIPIALIHHEKLLHHCGTGAASEETPYNIALYRIRYKPPTPSSSSAGKKGKGGQTQLQLAGSKRKSGGELVLAPAAAASVPEAKRKGREYEYVDITRLYRGLRNVLSKCGVRQATHELHYMRMLSVLVGLSGTDFSRNLPHVGPTTMWSMLLEGDIFSALVRAYDPSANGMRVEDACNMFVARSVFPACLIGDIECSVCNELHICRGNWTCHSMARRLRFHWWYLIARHPEDKIGVQFVLSGTPDAYPLTFKHLQGLLSQV